jgi:hypothetical protein
VIFFGLCSSVFCFSVAHHSRIIVCAFTSNLHHQRPVVSKR